MSNDQDESYPLTAAQRGILFHSLDSCRLGTYWPQQLWEMSGPCDLECLRAAWQMTIDQHDSLRTSFHWEERAEPCQQVHARAAVRLDVDDLRALDSTAQAARIEELRVDELRRVPPLSQPPLMRLRVIRTAADSWMLLRTHYHGILDRRSSNVILRDALAAYADLMEDAPASTSERPQFRQYAHWLAAQDTSTAQQYWRELFSDCRGAHAQLSDVAQPPRLGAYTHREHSAVCDVAVRTALQKVAERLNSSFTALLHVAWALALRDVSGESDVVFGMSRLGRAAPVEGIAEIVGMLVTTLPVRVRLDPQQPAAELAQAIRRQHQCSRAYEYTPLSTIERWAPTGAAGPLFESLVNFDFRSTRVEDGDIAGARLVDVHGHAHYPVVVMVDAYPDLQVRVAFDQSQVSADRAAMLLGQCVLHLRNLALLLCAPAMRIGDMAVVPASASGSARSDDECLDRLRYELIRQAWQHVLRVPVESADDNFFELGGHSIAAMQVMARVGDEVGVRLSAVSLLRTPGLGEFARLVTAAARG